jgi:hypothetical protein
MLLVFVCRKLLEIACNTSEINAVNLPYPSKRTVMKLESIILLQVRITLINNS